MMAWWRTKHRNFDYKVTLTREEAEGFLHGRLDALLPKLYPDLSKHTVFVAGSPEFTDACVAAAKALGVRDEMLHTEGFFSQQQLEAGDDGQLLSA
jgi:CDP-4-dehydro-6-deoxyglucose reductase